MRNRNSSFELMRIVSMIFIVIGHTLSWGGVTDSANDFLKLIIYIIYALIVVHVNSFVLLTGYYQVQSKFKIKKGDKYFNLNAFLSHFLLNYSNKFRLDTICRYKRFNIKNFTII